MSANCFVPGCTTGNGNLKAYNRKHGIKNPSVFRPPSNEMLKNWEAVIRRIDKRMEKTNVVCELHFKDDDIEREYVTHMPDGSVFKLKRGTPNLKFGAIPSIFNNYPKYYANVVVQKRKAPAPRNPILTLKKKRSNIHENATTQETFETSFLENDFLHFDIDTIKLPTSYWSSCKIKNVFCFTCWEDDLSKINKRVILFGHKEIKVYVYETQVFINELEQVNNYVDVGNILQKVEELKPCLGANETIRAENCTFYSIPSKYNSQFPSRCLMCKKYRKHLMQINKRIDIKSEKNCNNMNQLKGQLRNVVRKNLRLKSKVVKLRTQVHKMMQKCAKVQYEAVEKSIKHLPEAQQEAVRTCINFSKVNNSKNLRYTTQWIYECLLLRIKSRKAYEHIRHHNILPLPCVDTLNTYLRNIKGTYGFQNHTFEIIKKKVAHMSSQGKRGVLLVDEMKLSKGISFNKNTLEIQGFTNLGKYTPHHQKNAKGDHALVLMYQPFQGKWVQSLGCFLSKGCASGTVLHQILAEAILLTENAGLYVDGIVSDGATWNRNMWSKFGLNNDSSNCSVEHIRDSSRKLWFISDFPHLIKNLRNFLIKHDETWTPCGILKLKHWRTLLAIENEGPFHIQINYKLTEDHLMPKYFQKMNVPLAYQFFDVSESLELLQNYADDLKDSKGTQIFCKIIKNLITAMDSRTPCGSLNLKNKHWQAIKDFSEFLEVWEREAKNNKYYFISNSTSYGMAISLKATMELCEFLISKCDYRYLMTARLNQDALERFFGLMRNVCGSNDHPDSTLFLQMYRLATTYSLVKPVKGSNIEGKEILEVLLTVRDIEDTQERKEQWVAQVDTIIDKGKNLELLEHSVLILSEHMYCKSSVSDYIMTYLAGYVGKKISKFIEFKENGKSQVCQGCLDSLKLPENVSHPERHRLIDIKNKGGLMHPSGTLFSLTKQLEEIVLGAVSKGVNKDTLFQITECLLNCKELSLIGCHKHSVILTQKVVRFYLIMRMHFLCKTVNKKNSIEKSQRKEKRKAAKLI